MHFTINRLTVLLGTTALALALSGCLGGGSSSSSTTLSGTAMAGPFLSGSVCAYKVTNGAKGALLGTCASIAGATSSFSVNVGDYTGDVLVEVEAGSKYDDEATVGDEVTGTTLTGALRSLVHIATAGGTINLAVTPLTETALRLAPTLTDADVQNAVALLANLLGVSPNLDLRSTLPVLTTDQGLAYREALRALSQLQSNTGGESGFRGDMNAYLTNFSGQIGANGNTVAADVLGQINAGLNSHCTVANNVLTCSVATTGGGETGGGASGLSCNTSHYESGAVHLPTANELAAFAKTYTGNTGTFDMTGFTASGSAVFVLNSAGALTYNGSAQTVNSICADNTLPMLYVELGTTGGVDFFSDGSFTGNLADGTGVKSAAATGGGSGSGGGSAANPTGIVLTAKTLAAASDIASMVGHYAFPAGLRTGAGGSISDCVLDVAANGTFTLAGGGYTYTASVAGKTFMGNNLDSIFGVNPNMTVTGFAEDHQSHFSATVQNGYLVKVESPGLTCTYPNPYVTSAGTSDLPVGSFASANNLASSHVGTYRNADNCQLVVGNDGTFHFTLPAAATLTSSTGWSGSANVASNATALDITTQLGGDAEDKVGGVWVTYGNGIGGNVQAIATDNRLLDGHFVYITFYQSQNLGGLGSALGTTVTYLDTPASMMTTSNRAVCSDMVKQ